MLVIFRMNIRPIMKEKIAHPLKTSKQNIIQQKPQQNVFDEEKYCTEFPEMPYRPAGQ